MIKLNCPYCLDPVASHGDVCNAFLPDSQGGDHCPCNKSDVEILIEMVETLTPPAIYGVKVRRNAEDFLKPLGKGIQEDERLRLEKVDQVLAGIEFVEDEEVGEPS